MLAEEYMLIVPFAYQLQFGLNGSQMTFGIYNQLSIFTQQQFRAEGSQNISTAESPGRYASC
jgi:hypothetical protein